MKIRSTFVSNSSSCSFVINNKTKVTKTVKDFVIENPNIVVEFCQQYNWKNITQEQMIKSAKKDYSKVELKPGRNIVVFGDSQGTVVGDVFDYMLRDGGSSKSFSWEFDEMLR